MQAPRLLLLMALVTSGCDSPGASQGGAPTAGSPQGGGPAGVVPLACLADVPCELDSDCGDGQRCNTALTSPQCQRIHCGSDQTLCSHGALCRAELLCSAATDTCTTGGAGNVCVSDDDCGPGLGCPSRWSYESDPLRTEYGELVAWWTTGRPCIQVTYDAALAPWHELIAQAMAAWTDAACTDLCLTGPTVADAPSSGERALHLRLWDGWSNEGWRLGFDRRSGEIQWSDAGVYIDNGADGARFVTAVGLGLGFDFALDWTAEELTDAVCAMYPIMRCR